MLQKNRGRVIGGQRFFLPRIAAKFSTPHYRSYRKFRKTYNPLKTLKKILAPGVFRCYTSRKLTIGRCVAGNYSKNSALTDRFVRALLPLAAGQEQAIAGELAQLKVAIEQSADLRRLIFSPLFLRAQQKAAMLAVLEDAKASKLLLQFIGTLADAKRLALLPEIADGFAAALSAMRGEVVAELRTAHALSAEQEQNIIRQLASNLGGKKIILRTQIDPSLLGGLSVRIGSQLWDASLRSKLNGLKLVLSNAA